MQTLTSQMEHETPARCWVLILLFSVLKRIEVVMPLLAKTYIKFICSFLSADFYCLSVFLNFSLHLCRFYVCFVLFVCVSSLFMTLYSLFVHVTIIFLYFIFSSFSLKFLVITFSIFLHS